MTNDEQTQPVNTEEIKSPSVEEPEANEQLELLKDIRYTLEGFENLLQELLKTLSRKKRKPAKKAVKKGKRK